MSEFFSIAYPVQAFVSVANINEVLVFENSQQQGLNVINAACEPTNVNLFNPVVFELHPVVGSGPRDIRASGVLSYDAF